MKHNQTSLFLMEFIVGILFFSLALGLCIQIFVKAKILNDESVQKSQAQLIATSIIENEKVHSYNDTPLYFDEQGTLTSQENSPYLAKINKQNHLLKISIYYQNHEIYTIEYYHYQQRRWEVSS